MHWLVHVITHIQLIIMPVIIQALLMPEDSDCGGHLSVRHLNPRMQCNRKSCLGLNPLRVR
jgi:hypothetical protein